MVRFVPPAPLDAATLSGAFPFRSISSCRNSSASLCISLHLSSIALQGFAVPSLVSAFLFHAIAVPNQAKPPLIVSLPCRCGAAHRESVGLPSNAVQFRSLPLHVTARPCHTVASLSDSVANRGYFYAIAPHSHSERFLCRPQLFSAVAVRLIPALRHCDTKRRSAKPLRYSISSQRNRPFPLFRHWPMPEKRP